MHFVGFFLGFKIENKIVVNVSRIQRYIHVYSGGTQHKSFAQNRNFHNITLVRLVWEMCIFNLIYYHDRLASYLALLQKNFAKFILRSCTVFTYFANIRSTHKLNLIYDLVYFLVLLLFFCLLNPFKHKCNINHFPKSIKFFAMYVYSTIDSIKNISYM